MVQTIITSLFALSLLHLHAAIPLAPDCSTLLYSPAFADLPASFPGVVAHGVHSLTLPDIHHYFPNNKKDIVMPIVNPDLLSFEPIIFSPPDFQHTFASPSMRAVDLVLSHMNSPHWSIRLYTDMEKLVHAAHMQEIWLHAGAVYAELQQSNDVKEDLCECIQDVENNGIIRMLRLTALKLREPGLMYGEHTPVINKGENTEIRGNNWQANNYGLIIHTKKPEEAAKDIKEIVYSVINFDKDGETEEAAKETKEYINHVKNLDKDAEIKPLHHLDSVHEINGNDWQANHYRLIIEDDPSKKTEEVAKESKDNIYSVINFDKDGETEEDAKEIKENVYDIKNLNKDAENKPLPHLDSVHDWETWKAAMIEMNQHMDEYSRMLALYMHCMMNQ